MKSKWPRYNDFEQVRVFQINLLRLVIHIGHVQQQYVSLAAKNLANVRLSSPQVPMHELFDVSSRRCEHVQSHVVLTDPICLQSVHSFVTNELAASMQHSHRSLLGNFHLTKLG